MIFSSRKAFTLIELLVVVATIGILSSIVLSTMNQTRSKARDARRMEDLKQIQSALELYANDHSGAYPAGGAGSDRPDWINNTGLTANHPLGALKDGGYMAKVPYDPGTNTYTSYGSGCGGAQFYAYWSDGVSYILGAVSEIKGNTGCIQNGNWSGPTNTAYTYQYYIRNGA